MIKVTDGGWGYVRVSTDNQNPDLQFEALKAAGIPPHRIISDVESGTHIFRPGYQKLIKLINMGNIKKLTFNRIDRLGRDHYELVSFLKLADEKNIVIVSLCEPFVKEWNKSSWAFRATWEAVGDARYELLRLKERQRQGIDTAQDAIRRGTRTKGMGRPRKMGISSNP